MADKSIRYVEPDYDTLVQLDHEYGTQLRSLLMDKIWDKRGLFGEAKGELADAVETYALKYARLGAPIRDENEATTRAKFVEVYQKRLGDEIITVINQLADNYNVAIAPQAISVGASAQPGLKAGKLER
jgi:hypothetical protein